MLGSASSAAYGYDVAGNQTLFVDGSTNATVYTYNPWNLRESTIEPSTTAHPDPEDRTWITVYDAGGLPIAEILPGGVTVERTFDELARLVEEEGTGDGTATRLFDHDLVSNLIGVDHPDGTIGFGYDDRRLLTDQTGPAGAVTFSYDGAGRMDGRVDATGTNVFTWTARGELDTLIDPLTGATLDYSWDEASQLIGVEYGVGGAARSYGYDDLGRLESDTLVDVSPATVVEVEYGYDSDSNVVSKMVTFPGNDAEGLHEFGYDYSGRLLLWELGLGSTVYEWDDAGNRVKAGADVYTYDQRNRLLTGPVGDYSYTPRGTLSRVDVGVADPEGMTVVVLTGPGVDTWTPPAEVDSLERVFVIGAGGGGMWGGSSGPGGGGAGEVKELIDYAVTPEDPISFTIGGGGGAGYTGPPQVPAQHGGNTVFDGVTALGGGPGAGHVTVNTPDRDGGSGGRVRGRQPPTALLTLVPVAARGEVAPLSAIRAVTVPTAPSSSSTKPPNRRRSTTASTRWDSASVSSTSARQNYALRL